MALRKLATIFQCSIQKNSIADPGVPEIAPPHRPCTRSQTKALANAAIRAPHGPTVSHTQPQQYNDPKYKEGMVPYIVCVLQNNNKPRIVPIIKKPYAHSIEQNMKDCWKILSPSSNQQTLSWTQTQGSNSSTNISSIIQTAKLSQTWQRLSANEFGRLAQRVGGRIEGTETIKFLQYHEMPKDRQPTHARFVC